MAADSLIEKMKGFDYIRLTTPDIHGNHMCKLLPTRHAKKIVDCGTEIYTGIIAFGPRNEIVQLPEVWDLKFANGPMKPIPETFHPLPWATDHSTGRKVAEVFCETLWPDKSPIEAHPRYVVRQQIDKLEAMGYKMYSSFEPEFRAFRIGTLEPVTQGEDMCKANFLAEVENFFMTADTQLLEAGVELEDMQNENGSGQLESPLKPSYGVKAADNGFLFKQAMKEIGRHYNYQVSFMTTPLMKEPSSGWHYNHSLWDIKTDANAMYDSSAPKGLSKTAQHWIGGILKHLPAITALCCPTVNCYRRLHRHLAPSSIVWDFNDRYATIRAKTGSEKGTYVENRLPSAATNPYVAMAATLVAGMDGLVNAIDPPSPGSRECGKLPSSLGEALTLLENDEVIVSGLGDQFVDWFVRVKRGADLVTLADANVQRDTEEALDKERKEYFEFV